MTNAAHFVWPRVASRHRAGRDLFVPLLACRRTDRTTAPRSYFKRARVHVHVQSCTCTCTYAHVMSYYTYSFMVWPPHWSRFLDMLTFPAVASRALCSRYSCIRRCTVRALKFSEDNRFFSFSIPLWGKRGLLEDSCKEAVIILQRIGVLTFSPTFRLGGPTAFLGVCIPVTLRATRATRGG